MHMISIYTRPGIRTGDKGGRAACLGFGQSRVVAGFGGVRAEPHGAGDLPGRQINENVTRKLGLEVLNQERPRAVVKNRVGGVHELGAVLLTFSEVPATSPSRGCMLK